MKWPTRPSAALIFSLLFYGLILFSPSQGWQQALYQRFDYLIYDLRFKLGLWLQDSQGSSVVIIDIDESSLQRLGHWPWPRTRLAELTERLFQAGAVVVGFDVVFPEADPGPLAELLNSQSLPAELQRSLSALSQQLDADQRFAQALAAGDTVLSFVLHQDPFSSGHLPLSPVKNLQSVPARLPDYASFTGNLRQLQTDSQSAGAINIHPDSDGILRRVPLLLAHQQQLYPALSMEMLRRYLLLDQIELQTQPDTGRLQALTLGSIRIPVNAQAEVLIPYQRESNIPYYSAANILRQPLPDLTGKLVLIGASAYGLHDIKATPLTHYFAGVEIHATLLNALLHGKQSAELQSAALTEGEAWLTPASQRQFPHQVEADLPSKLLLLLLSSLVLLLPRQSPQSLLLTAISSLLLITSLDFALFHYLGLVLSSSQPLLLILGLSFINLACGFIGENRRKLHLKARFSQYVPPAHVEAMLKTEQPFGMDGETRDMTVLFADIRQFTSISEQLSANELKALLNTFFTPMTRIIFEQQGTIDKYVGDMIMAFWGAPLADPQHADHAIAAALAMLAEVERLQTELKARNLPAIQIGIGINSGPMNVGDMGSEYRLAYTVLGDAVNLASRLEGQTKEYGVSLLIGEETFARQSRFVCRELDQVRVKGKQQAIVLYQPLCLTTQASPELLDRLNRHQQALDAYRSQQWSWARQLLQRLQTEQPHDKVYPLYLQRIAQLETQTLAADWDGIITRDSK